MLSSLFLLKFAAELVAIQSLEEFRGLSKE